MASSLQDFPFGIMDVVELLHLKIRRRQTDSVYVDCPFCGDQRGKMNVNMIKNVWRCNYCLEHGGMLALYAQLNHTSNSDAYREICDALQTGETTWGFEAEKRTEAATGRVIQTSRSDNGVGANTNGVAEILQSPRAGIQEIHQTLSLLLEMLTLTSVHREHLRSERRGLTDDQIDSFGFKSTPPYFLCRSLTERLIKKGCIVQGVPGFYQNRDGQWTVKFNSRTAGILIPVIGVDGLIRGAQILLDHPIKDKDDPPDKAGTKYLWLSSSGKHLGITSGSPVHFVGNPFARTIYVTEGILKSDIAHCLMNRSFAATAGANNVKQLDPLFALLAQNGTEQIIEAHDMDKYSNKMTDNGGSKIYVLARKYGMECRRLTWNPNYKGVDDWQLAIRKKEKKSDDELSFKQIYMLGQCEFIELDDWVERWHTSKKDGCRLADYLGLTEDEYTVFCRDGSDELQNKLNAQRHCQSFRIYQLDFSAEHRTIPFAFKGIQALHKAGFEQPPAAEYRLVWDGKWICPANGKETEILRQIFNQFNNCLPDTYSGRSLSSSDVIELYDEIKRCYFYVDGSEFVPVCFSPFLAKPVNK